MPLRPGNSEAVIGSNARAEIKLRGGSDRSAKLDAAAARIDSIVRRARGDADFKESDHPRGQPENAGQFGAGGGGKESKSGKSEKSEPSEATKESKSKREIRGVNEKEKQALKAYTLAGSYPLNDFLRNGTSVEKGKWSNATPLRTNEDVKEAVQEIDSAMERASLDKETTVFRGVNNDVWKMITEGLEVGGVIQDKGFVSTSLKKLTSSSLTHFMKIVVPKGAKAIPLEGLVPNRSAGEILLNRGTRFRVVSKTKTNMVLEVIDDDAKKADAAGSVRSVNFDGKERGDRAAKLDAALTRIDSIVRARCDMDGAPRSKRMYPGYTLSELQEMVKTATGETLEKMSKEIVARESGASKVSVTPQIQGGKVQVKVGRL